MNLLIFYPATSGNFYPATSGAFNVYLHLLFLLNPLSVFNPFTCLYLLEILKLSVLEFITIRVSQSLPFPDPSHLHTAMQTHLNLAFVCYISGAFCGFLYLSHCVANQLFWNTCVCVTVSHSSSVFVVNE